MFRIHSIFKHRVGVCSSNRFEAYRTGICFSNRVEDFPGTQEQLVEIGEDPSMADMEDKFCMKSEEARLKLKCDSFYYSKNKSNLGEDAHFICNDKQTIAVADGVGGWSLKGIDAGQYARDLMNYALIALSNESRGTVNPRRILNRAYTQTKALGSSTACVITLGDDNFLHAVNIGDSGFMVFRKNKLVYSSPSQQHYFNCPFQLGSTGGDHPNAAETLEFHVENGDYVVAGTDGLFDNVYPAEMETILKDYADCLSVKQLAWFIAGTASHNSKDPSYLSPYARSYGDPAKIGGKADDITVVVGLIDLKYGWIH